MLKHSVILWLVLTGAGSCRCYFGNRRGFKSDYISSKGKESEENRQDAGDLNNTVWQPQGNIQKASQWIKSDQDWLASLSIPKNSKESVVVNAANGGLGGGGGIDGALCNWAKNSLGRPFTTWRAEAKLPNGSTPPNPLPTGDFAIFDTPFGWIYLAVGPIAGSMQSLDEAKQKVSHLYQHMLDHAHKNNAKRIVLPAISTDIFAGGGKGFTKEEFIQTVYKAMIEGIENFQKAYPSSKLLIIVNNWDQEVVQKVKP